MRHAPARVDERRPLADVLAAVDLDQAHLDDAVVAEAAAGGLEVEEDERLGEQ